MFAVALSSWCPLTSRKFFPGLIPVRAICAINPFGRQVNIIQKYLLLQLGVHLAREEEQEQQEAVGEERRQGQLQPRGQIWQSSRVQSSGRQR